MKPLIKNAIYVSGHPDLHLNMDTQKIVDFWGINEKDTAVLSKDNDFIFYSYDHRKYPRVNGFYPGIEVVRVYFGPGKNYFCMVDRERKYDAVFTVRPGCSKTNLEIFWSNLGEGISSVKYDDYHTKKKTVYQFMFSTPEKPTSQTWTVTYYEFKDSNYIDIKDFFSLYWEISVNNRGGLSSIAALGWGTRFIDGDYKWVREDPYGFIHRVQEEFPLEFGKEYHVYGRGSVAVFRVSDLVGKKRALLLGDDMVDCELHPKGEPLDYGNWMAEDHLSELIKIAKVKLRKKLYHTINELKRFSWILDLPDDLVVNRRHVIDSGCPVKDVDIFIKKHNLDGSGTTLGELRSKGLLKILDVLLAVDIAWDEEKRRGRA